MWYVLIAEMIEAFEKALTIVYACGYVLVEA